MSHRGATVVAKIRKATAVETHLTGIDLILIVNTEVWHALEDEPRLAVLDHELCHVDRADDGSYKIRGHDLEEFHAIVGRHGDWRPGILELTEQLDAFRKAARAG